MKKTNTLGSVLEELYDYIEIGDEKYWIRKDWDQKEKEAYIEKIKRDQKELESEEYKSWKQKQMSKYG